MINPNLSVKFEDGELIQGVEWKDLPNEPIYSMKLKFKDEVIYLSGYEEYNHLIEFVYAVLEGTKLIRSIYLMGRTKEYSQVIRVNYLTGEKTDYQTNHNEEYDAVKQDDGRFVGRPSTGWKKGLLNLEASFN